MTLTGNLQVPPESRGAARLESINCSAGGVPKLPVSEAWITKLGVEGDRQTHTKFHGGPERAVSLYSLELIRKLQEQGHPIAIGTAGENLTISGIEWQAVAPGTEVEIGEVRLCITSYASPCRQIRNSLTQGQISRLSQKLHPGWSRVYARVMNEGRVRILDAIKVQNGL